MPLTDKQFDKLYDAAEKCGVSEYHIPDRKITPVGIVYDPWFAEAEGEKFILFSNGSRLAYYHYPDCCEYNYAEFESLDDTGFWEAEFDKISLEVSNGGFKINGFHVNCYSSQSGYYSNEVTIVYVLANREVVCRLNAYGDDGYS